MADRKISDLTALTAPAAGDYLPIVDISEVSAANKNKRITIEELLRGAPDGTAAAPSIGFESDPNTGIYSPGADQVAVATNGVGRLFVDASGNVGVGNSDFGAPVQIRAASPALGSPGTVFVQSSTSAADAGGQITFGSSTARHAAIAGRSDAASTAGYLQIGTRGASGDVVERLRITSAGLVGIGTSAPNVPLEVVGNIHMSGAADRTIFNRANNALSLGTNNTTRLHITNAGNVGIGTTSPAMPLSVKADASRNAIQIINGGAATEEGRLYWYASDASTIRAGISGQENGLVFFHGASVTERARIDSSGRLLVGTSSARSNFAGNTSTPLVQIEGVTAATASSSVVRGAADATGPTFNLGKTRGASVGQHTVVVSGDQCGVITFQGADGTNLIRAAQIAAEVDGTPGADDMPGRLVFSVTADGASSPTEALRISNNRAITVSDGGNVVLGTTTGTKIGTATTQKLAFYNATPVVQPAAVADATDAATVITQLNDLLAKLRTLGIIAT